MGIFHIFQINNLKGISFQPIYVTDFMIATTSRDKVRNARLIDNNSRKTFQI